MRLTPFPCSRPWHAGLLVYFVLVLTSSLLASPWVAAGLEFGHLHPDDAPAHVHDISGILTGAVTAALVALSVVAAPAAEVAHKPLQQYTEAALFLGRAIRAPPS